MKSAERWSSARAHVTGQDSSQLLDMASWREICEPADPEQLLAREEDATEVGRLRHATRTGRPCGDGSFVEQMEQRLGRRLRLAIGGRPLRGQAAVAQGYSHQVFDQQVPPKAHGI